MTVHAIASFRTEAEVAADTVYALIRAGIIPTTVKLAELLAAVALTAEDLRMASVRWEVRNGRTIVPQGTLPPNPQSPVETATQATAARTPHPAPPPPASPEPAVTERRCRRCQKTKPIEQFPVRKGKPKWWCRDCSVTASVRVVQQRRSWENAYLALVLEPGDECIGVACDRCQHPLQAGDTMVVHGRPRHDRCPGATR